MVADTIADVKKLCQYRILFSATTKSLIVKSDKAIIKVAKLRSATNICHNLTLTPLRV